MKKRDEMVDTAKGIGMLLVVLGHMQSSALDLPVQFLYLFHMPLFFFLSGFFCHVEQPMEKYLWKKTLDLLLPFGTYCVIQWIFSLPIKIATATSIEDFMLDAMNFSQRALWFLIALWWCFIYKWITYWLNHMEPLAVLGMGILGFYLAYNEMELPVYLTQSFIAFPFFYLGNVYKNHKVNNMYTLYDLSLKPAFAAPAALMSFAVLVYFTGTITLDISTLVIPDILPVYICALLGTMMTLQISRFIFNIKYLSFIKEIGKRTLPILGLHSYIMSNLWCFSLPIVRRIYLLFEVETEGCIIKDYFWYAVAVFIITVVSSYLLAPYTERINKNIRTWIESKTTLLFRL